MTCTKCGEPTFGDNWHCDDCKEGKMPFYDDDIDDDIREDVCETCGAADYKHFPDCPDNINSGLYPNDL